MNRPFFPLALAGVVALAIAPSAWAQSTGSSSGTTHAATVFRANCATCHGEDGGGSAVGKSLHAPDLRSAAVQTKSDASLAHFISEGSGAMPPFKGTLSHQQILDEVKYIRTLSHHSAKH